MDINTSWFSKWWYFVLTAAVTARNTQGVLQHQEHGAEAQRPQEQPMAGGGDHHRFHMRSLKRVVTSAFLLPGQTASSMAYRSSRINIPSYLFVLMRSSVSRAEAADVRRLGLESGWVGLSAEARCRKTWFAPTFVVIWPGSHRPGKMKECLVSALMARPAASPLTLTRQKQPSRSCEQLASYNMQEKSCFVPVEDFERFEVCWGWTR